MTYISLGNIMEEIGKYSWKGDMRRGGQEITFSQVFNVICATFEILKEETRPMGATKIRA